MNQADTAWMLISTALVLLMTPALAFGPGPGVHARGTVCADVGSTRPAGVAAASRPVDVSEGPPTPGDCMK